MPSEVTETRVGDRRPGGRAARVRAAVLAATSDLLDEVGYDALTVDDIATRAGVHRTTVYRRWPTLPELVGDAVGLEAEEQVPIPDTGSLAGDLSALATAMAATMGTDVGSRRARSMVAAALSSDDVAEQLRRFIDRRIELATPIVDRAVDRGDLAPDVDPRAVLEPVVGTVWFRLLLTDRTTDPARVEAIAHATARGHRP